MTEKREIFRDALVVAVLSVLMGTIMHRSWRSIYSQAAIFEQRLLEAMPGVTDGGIQILATFGLGLYITWLVLFTHDIRKRIQGVLFILGSLIALAILWVLGTFWPYVDPTPINGVAFAVGVGLGLGSEFFETPVHDGDPALFDIDISRSSVGHVVTQSGENADFPVATWGIFVLLLVVVVGAIGALVLAGASPVVLGASSLVAVLFLWRLNALLGYEFTGMNIEILGPQGSGKTLFFYGIQLTVDDENSPYRSISTDDAWMNKVNTIKTRQASGEDPWGPASTDVDTEFDLSFRREGLVWEFVRVALTDFPGGWLEDIFNAGRDTGGQGTAGATAMSDGGTTSGGNDDGYEFMPGSGGADELEDIDGVTPEIADALREQGFSTPEDVAGSEIDDLIEVDGVGIATAADMLQDVGEPAAETPDTSGVDGDGDESDATDADVPRGPSNVTGLEESLLRSDKILAIIDTKAAIEAGLLPVSEEDTKGMDPDDRNRETPKVDVTWRICSVADPDEIVLVATKTDYLIPKYKEEMNATGAPHEELGDFGEFRKWVNSQFDRQPFALFQGENVCETIYPVYYQSKEDENGNVVPDLGDGEMQPEGFDVLIEERLIE